MLQIKVIGAAFFFLLEPIVGLSRNVKLNIPPYYLTSLPMRDTLQ